MSDERKKLDPKSVAITCGILALSWAAFPIVYYLVQKNKDKKVEEEPKQT